MGTLRHYKNFVNYTPERTKENADLLDHGVGFSKDENGNDWYELRKTFREYTWKLVYAKDGSVIQCEQDVQELAVQGSAGVVELEEIPAEYSRHNMMQWWWDGEKLTWYPRYFENQKASLISMASKKIEQYADFMALGEEGLEGLLNAWRAYRLAVYKVDLGVLPFYDWPEKPDDL